VAVLVRAGAGIPAIAALHWQHEHPFHWPRPWLAWWLRLHRGPVRCMFSVELKPLRRFVLYKVFQLVERGRHI